MPIGQVNYEQQYVLRDAGGNIIWSGSGIGGCAYRVTSGESSTTISAGQAVIVDTTDANTVLGRDQNPGTSDPDVQKLSVLQCVSGGVALIGVASQNIPATKQGNIFGPGALVAVRCTSGAIALGAQVIASATAGLVATAGTKSATVPAYGTVLGVCVKAAAQIGSTGNYTAGVLICPM